MLRNIKSRLYGSALPFIAADRVKVRMQGPAKRLPRVACAEFFAGSEPRIRTVSMLAATEKRQPFRCLAFGCLFVIHGHFFHIHLSGAFALSENAQ